MLPLATAGLCPPGKARWRRDPALPTTLGTLHTDLVVVRARTARRMRHLGASVAAGCAPASGGRHSALTSDCWACSRGPLELCLTVRPSYAAAERHGDCWAARAVDPGDDVLGLGPAAAAFWSG